MKKIFLFLMCTAVFFITGCSTKVLLPYEEEPLCTRGKEGGYCGSLSDIYKQLEEEDND